MVFHGGTNISGFEKINLVERSQPINTQREEVGNLNDINELGHFREDLEEQSNSGQLAQRNVKREYSGSPVESFDSNEDIWTYQQLITSMVSRMRETSTHQEKYSDDFIQYEVFNQQSQFSEDLSLKRYSEYLETGGSPSRFSINVVEPLHYLPIAPTINNGRLFHLCKSRIPFTNVTGR